MGEANGRHRLSYTFQGQVEFTERMTQRQTECNQGKDQEINRYKENTGLRPKDCQRRFWRRVARRRKVELQMPLGLLWLWSGSDGLHNAPQALIRTYCPPGALSASRTGHRVLGRGSLLSQPQIELQDLQGH